MSILEKIKTEAKPWRRHIAVLVGEDRKLIQAVEGIYNAGIANLTLIGKKEVIKSIIKEEELPLSKVAIVDYKSDFRLRQLAAVSSELNLIPCDSQKELIELISNNPLVFSALFLKAGFADALIVGNAISYSELADISSKLIGMKTGIETVSSTNIMVTKTAEYGVDGVLFFSDCHVNKNPSSSQLADIAISTVELAERVFGQTRSKTSLLSFSTKGSAKDPLVDKVVDACKILEQRHVAFNFDGELQLDASIVPSVGQSKAPKSEVAGHANILIFPSLNSGNIGYNLVKVLGKAETVGPIMLGLAKPIQRVPETYSQEDLVNIAAIAAIESTL